MPADAGHTRQTVSGPVALVLGVAFVAGLCAFAIAYDEALHHLPRRAARRHGLATGLGAAAFFAVLGVLLVPALFR